MPIVNDVILFRSVGPAYRKEVIPGPAQPEPGIHNHRRDRHAQIGVMDSGLAQERAPE